MRYINFYFGWYASQDENPLADLGIDLKAYGTKSGVRTAIAQAAKQLGAIVEIANEDIELETVDGKKEVYEIYGYEVLSIACDFESITDSAIEQITDQYWDTMANLLILGDADGDPDPRRGAIAKGRIVATVREVDAIDEDGDHYLDYIAA